MDIISRLRIVLPASRMANARSMLFCPPDADHSMGQFRIRLCQPERAETPHASCALALIACLAVFLIREQPVQAQSQDQVGSAILQGSVLDSSSRPIAGATVYLEKDGAQTLTCRTDSEGSYRFSALGDGVYKLRAEMAGYVVASFGPCSLGPKETKRVDLTLQPSRASPPQNGSPGTSSGTSEAEKPQYFDEPQFTVAGVTEAMNPGGHGSNTILRTAEALAKETASLGIPAVKTESGSSRMSAPSLSTPGEDSLRKQAEREPGNFKLNYQFGKMLVAEGKAREALQYLERASQLNPVDYENAYELAVAHADAGQYERANVEAQTLLARPNEDVRQQAELHHLLGTIEERLGHPLEAVHEYQRAAELDPSEPNLFDWGTELLIHRAFEPAIEVFVQGNRLFPRSSRMLAGLGVVWYARGAYDQAAQSLCQASDLNPDDPNPYLFLGKMQSIDSMQSDCVVERLGRFLRLQPENAMANYYYGLSLSRQDGDVNKLAQAESLLEKAVRLDPKLAAAHLQLGILYYQQGVTSEAISAYRKAIEANPQLVEAHYRLGQLYSRAGEKLKAQDELQIYEQLSKKTAEETERERREIQQFVYTLRRQNSAAQP
jgi:tetratricopeptide (TPR) repeat protein